MSGDDIGLFREDGDEESPLRNATRVIGAEPGLPSFKKLMTGILSALDSPTIRLSELSTLVTHDFSLSLKLTRTANSALYNRSGRPIVDLEHVIFMLGAKIIRELASSIMYFNEYSRKTGGLQELLLLSLVRASVARELAILRHVEAPESRFLAGMFHDLGQVLVAAHFSPAYLEIRTRSSSPEDPDPRVVREVLGFDFAELGQKIGAEWGLPDYVIRAMTTGDTWSVEHHLVRLAHGLTIAAFATPYESKREALQRARLRHRSVIPVSPSQIGRVLNTAVAETSEIFAGAGMQLADLRLLSDPDMAGAFLDDDANTAESEG